MGCARWYRCQPQVVMVRKGRRKAGENIAVITERSRGIAVRIEIEPLGPDQVELMVFVSAPGKKKVPRGCARRSSTKAKSALRSSCATARPYLSASRTSTYELAILREGKVLKRITFKTT